MMMQPAALNARIACRLVAGLTLGLLLGPAAPALRAEDHPIEPADAAVVEALTRAHRAVAQQALPAVVQVFSGLEGGGGNGSGVIIDSAEGMILTNHHVVEDSDSIQVRLQDGRRYPAQIVGSDPPTDLAVIRIEADNLACLRLGDSDALEVGDPVMTVGNPFGLQGTVSKGIVSAVNRYTPAGIISYEGFIQTDAVINPGNSGGPLVNMRGEIVGINTAIESSTGGFDGVGFAIPSARIKNVLPALVKGERVRSLMGSSSTGFRMTLPRSAPACRPATSSCGWTAASCSARNS
jgi:S1-C subfamily serine protease